MPMTLSITQRKAFVGAMDRFVRESSGWVPAYNPKLIQRMRLNSDFGKWIEQNGPQPKRCNCWEAVLIAGLNAGLWDKAYIEAAVEVVPLEPELALRRLVVFMNFRPPRKGEFFVGQIVMIGDEGQHFALSRGFGDVIELDNHRKGSIPLSDVLKISPYCNKTNEVYISDPPTLAELMQY